MCAESDGYNCYVWNSIEFVFNMHALNAPEMHCAISKMQNARGTERAIKMKLALYADHFINWQSR